MGEIKTVTVDVEIVRGEKREDAEVDWNDVYAYFAYLNGGVWVRQAGPVIPKPKEREG